MQKERFEEKLASAVEDLKKGKDPSAVYDQIFQEMEGIKEFIKKRPETYYAGIMDELKDIQKAGPRKLNDFLEDLIYELERENWEAMLWKWDEAIFRAHFLETVAEEMRWIGISDAEKERLMPQIAEAYLRVIAEEDMAKYLLALKPIKEAEWKDVLAAYPTRSVHKWTPTLLASCIAFAMRYNGLHTTGYFTLYLGEMLAYEICETLTPQ